MSRSLPHANTPAVERLAASLADHGARESRFLIVLGSGLDATGAIAGARAISHGEIEGMPASRVPGHPGSLVLGRLGGVPVAVQRGRVHLYEGWSAEEVVLSVRAFASLGCRGFVFTNAAGGLHAEWRPGALMRLVDHMNLQGATPLEHPERVASPYDVAWGTTLDRCARERKIELHRGVYAGLPGPSYETAAEVRMLAWMGADAVGMSTVCEVIAARASGGRVAAISCIANPAAGLSSAPLDHEHVLAETARASRTLVDLLAAAAPELDRTLG